ncbi:DMT family transporter [Piscinibacter sp. XHJ-5]|uniref:DMT family transporter n=1 Tax=Piscinibacter sp. XHJ-5 TaxID=3037797 RepID=UPI002453115E|nr:DMT family transporter [Piscinibacter sp. XHJ-5]
MDLSLPLALQWILAIWTLFSIGAFIIEKLPKVIEYVRSPPPAEPAKPRKDYWIGSGAALGCAVIWAASYASLGMISSSVSTLTTNIYLLGFAAASLYIASVVYGLFNRSAAPREPVQPPSGRIALLVAANLGNFVLSVLALKYISASEAMTLTNLAPIFLAVFLWYRGKLTGKVGVVLALMLVLAGVFILNIDGTFSLKAGSNISGSVVAALAGAAFAVWTLTLDEIKGTFSGVVSRLQTLALVFFLSYVVLVTLGYAVGRLETLTTTDYVLLALNGMRVACVHLLYLFAVEKAGPLLASVLAVLMVPFTFPFDRIWNGAAITGQLVLGAFLIVVAAAGLLSDELRKARYE